jgi:hypothetical protein
MPRMLLTRQTPPMRRRQRPQTLPRGSPSPARARVRRR